MLLSLLRRAPRRLAASSSLASRRTLPRCRTPTMAQRCLCTVSPTPPVAVHDVAGWLHAELGDDICALDARSMSGGGVGDFLLFASARSRQHMTRLASAVRLELKQRGVMREGQPAQIEGKHSEDWLVVDGGDVIVSVMMPAARQRLQLEDHWRELGASEVALGLAPHATPVDAAAAAAGVAGARTPEHWGVGGGASGESLGDVYAEPSTDLEDEGWADGGAAAGDVEAYDSDYYDDEDYPSYSSYSLYEYGGEYYEYDDSSLSSADEYGERVMRGDMADLSYDELYEMSYDYDESLYDGYPSVRDASLSDDGLYSSSYDEDGYAYPDEYGPYYEYEIEGSIDGYGHGEGVDDGLEAEEASWYDEQDAAQVGERGDQTIEGNDSNEGEGEGGSRVGRGAPHAAPPRTGGE